MNIPVMELSHRNADFDQQNISRSVIASTVAFVLIATAAVVLRLISRRVKRVALGSDDYTIVFGLVSSY